ncbi:MAG: hypothetical protein J6A62_08535 [Oscillospiraceae bacterium]|nr:hypothetical protein [Oscillospiraceae bacterium]
MIFIYVLLTLVLLFAYHNYSFTRKWKNRHVVNVYFGVPGSGKTTYAAWLTARANHKSLLRRLSERWPSCRPLSWAAGKTQAPVPVYSNVPILGTYKLDARNDLGYYLIEDAKIIIDEAGIDYNSRNYKSLPFETIKFFKLHRHYGTSIDVFSQSYEDMDITLRRLAQNYYLVRKSLIPGFIVIRLIRRRIGIDDQTHKVCDLYAFGTPVLNTQWVWMPRLWKLFDSYDAPELPKKDFKLWTSVNAESDGEEEQG